MSNNCNSKNFSSSSSSSSSSSFSPSSSSSSSETSSHSSSDPDSLIFRYFTHSVPKDEVVRNAEMRFVVRALRKRNILDDAEEILMRGGIHDTTTTTSGGKHVKDASGWHMTFSAKFKGMKKGFHMTFHAYADKDNHSVVVKVPWGREA